MIEPSMVSLSNPFPVCFAIQVMGCLWFLKPIYCFLSHSIQLRGCPCNRGKNATAVKMVVKRNSQVAGLLTTKLKKRLRLKSMEILIMNTDNSCFQSLWMFNIIFINPWASQPPPPKMDRRLMEWWFHWHVDAQLQAHTEWWVPLVMLFEVYKNCFSEPPAHLKWLPIALNDPQKHNFSIKHFMEYHDKNNFQYGV